MPPVQLVIFENATVRTTARKSNLKPHRKSNMKLDTIRRTSRYKRLIR